MSKEILLCFICQQLTEENPGLRTMPIALANDLPHDLFGSLEVFLTNCSIFNFFKKSVQRKQFG